MKCETHQHRAVSLANCTTRALSEYRVSKHTWHTLNAGPKLNKSSTIPHSHRQPHPTVRTERKVDKFKGTGEKNHSFSPSVSNTADAKTVKQKRKAETC